MSAAERLAALDGTVDTLLAIQQAQLAEWQAAGMPPTFSVDGESYSWGQWLASIDESIAKKLDQRQKIGGPFIVRSRGRA